MGKASDTIDDALEQTIAGEVAAFPDAFPHYAALGVESTDFARPKHQYLWTAAAALDEARQPITPRDLNRMLHEQGRATDCTPAYVFGISSPERALVWPKDPAACADHVRWQAMRLRELAILRRTEYDLRELRVDGRRAEDVQDDLARLHARFTRTIGGDPGTADVVWREAQAQAAQHADAGGAVLGLQSIDDNLEGIAPGRVCTILARSRVGKTFLLCRAAVETLRLGWGVIFVSLEMPRTDVFARLYRMVSGLDAFHFTQALRGGTLDASLWASTCRRLILFDQAYSLRDIDRLIQQAQYDALRDTPGVLVCLDYIGLLSGHERLTAYERMTLFAKAMKALAKRRRVALLVAAQVSRDAGDDGSKLLTLGSARDSGAVEEGSDYVLGFRRFDISALYTEDVRRDYKSVIFGSVLKNRHVDEPTREFAYGIDWRGITFHERLNLQPPELARRPGDALGTPGRRR